MIKNILKVAVVTSCLVSLSASAGGHEVKKQDKDWGFKLGYVHDSLNIKSSLDIINDSNITTSSRFNKTPSFEGIALGVDYRKNLKKDLFWGLDFSASKGVGSTEFDVLNVTRVRYKIENNFSLKPAFVLGKNFDQFNVYTKLGANISSYKIKKTFPDEDNAAGVSVNKSKVFYGPMVGLGAEFEILDNSSVFAEYNYSYLLEQKLPLTSYTDDDNNPFRLTKDKQKIGINSFTIGYKYSF